MDPWDPTDDGTRPSDRTLAPVSYRLAAGALLGVVTHGLAMLAGRDPLICYLPWSVERPQWTFALAGAEVIAAAIVAAALGYGLVSAVLPARILGWIFVIQAPVSGVALLVPPSAFTAVLAAAQLLLTVWAIGILRALHRRAVHVRDRVTSVPTVH